MGDMQFNGTPEEWDALVKKNRQTTVKLYTEEQVRKLLKKAFWQDFHDGDTEESLMNELTPIELPSDEEIEEQSWGYREVTRDMEIPPNEDWSNGAKWMRDKILNQNKLWHRQQ